MVIYSIQSTKDPLDEVVWSTIRVHTQVVLLPFSLIPSFLLSVSLSLSPVFSGPHQ